jgi:TPR repeat protein
MRKGEREAEGERLCRLADALADEEQTEAAIELYRLSAKLGNSSAAICLSNLLGDVAMPGPSPEAIYWIRRVAKDNPSQAWWNLAMYHRQRGRRRLYLYWLGKAAEAGDEDAIVAVNDPERLSHAWWALDGIDPPPPFRLRGV